MLETQVKDEGVLALMGRLAGGMHNPTPLMRAIAGIFEAETEANFAAQGRPKWLGLAPVTKKRRGSDAMILQDTGKLAASVVTAYGKTFVRIGSNRAYAAIHQFGGTIDRAAHSMKVRHRTDAKGELLRTGLFKGKGLVFAKDSHKRVKERWFEVGAHKVNIPARPYMPFDEAGNLQPTTREMVISEATSYLRSLVSA